MTTLNKAVSAVLSEKSQSLTTEVIGSERQVEGKWKLLGDSYQADGVKSSMLDKPAKKTDANPNATLQFQIQQAIIKALPATWQALLAKDTKTLSESDKQEKRYAQQQVGSKYGKIKRHLEKLENPNSSAPRVTRSAVERIIDSLNDAIEVAEKIEEPNFDIAGFKKIVASAKAMVK